MMRTYELLGQDGSIILIAIAAVALQSPPQPRNAGARNGLGARRGPEGKQKTEKKKKERKRRQTAQNIY